jgi:hypothetical protein
MRAKPLEIPYHPITRWAVVWRVKQEGCRRYIHATYMYDPNTGLPYLFKTRRQANEFINTRWGYIRDREDLRTPPHSWRIPLAVKVTVMITEE